MKIGKMDPQFSREQQRVIHQSIRHAARRLGIASQPGTILVEAYREYSKMEGCIYFPDGHTHSPWHMAINLIGEGGLSRIAKVALHETFHISQCISGRLGGTQIKHRNTGQIFGAMKWKDKVFHPYTPYADQPWEHEAHAATPPLYRDLRANVIPQLRPWEALPC
jgi:formylmethanofuran dehydrogenase subunit D